jgi:16S rRNA (uracil1498-N3)-methyltransferase
MSYFLYPEKLYIGISATLIKEEAAHLLLSRRVKVGEKVEIQDTTPNRFLCAVTQLGKKEITFTPLQSIPLPSGPKRIVQVYQALTAEQTMHVIIQKLTELGVQTLHVFPSRHSPGNISSQKLPRWKRISLEAAKQSGRPHPMDIYIHMNWPLTSTASTGTSIQLSQNARDPLSTVLNNTEKKGPITLWVGPEGGWSADETHLLTTLKAHGAHMGSYILKAETAAIAAASIALNL